MNRATFWALCLVGWAGAGLAATADEPPELKAIYAAADHGSTPVIIELQPVGAGDKAFDADAIAQRQDQVLSRLWLQKHRLDGIKRYQHLPMLAAELDVAAIKAALRDPLVRRVHPDIAYPPLLAQSTVLIGAGNSLPEGQGGSGQVVVILDTGSEVNHSFLASKLVDGACFSTTNAGQGSTSVCPNGSNPSGADSQFGIAASADCPAAVSGCSHGSHVAGIAAGRSSSFSGVARDAGLYPIQVFSRFPASTCQSDSDCVLSFSSDQLRALDHVFSRRNDFNFASINMSLGGGQFFAPCDTQPLKTAIDNLKAVGIATVIATGNNGFTDSIGAPACISSAISVGSTTKQDQVSSFSNSASFISLLAPGSSINSSVPGNGFASFNGTSMATPHVAGAFAVLKAAAPSASVDDLLAALRSTGVAVADQRTAPPQISKPRIQVDAALAALAAPGASRLQVTPSAGFAATGVMGGPFTPTSMVYTLSNSGSSDPINWTASENASWADVDPPSGTLAAGASTDVTVSINASAAELSPATRTATLSFSNTSNALGDSNRALQLAVSAPPAVNDKFSDSLLLDGSTGTTNGSNVGASKETGEPNHASSGGASVWWRWQAPANGELTVDTVGSSFDTLLAAYTGSAVNGLSLLASNDDTSGLNLRSRIRFSVQAGTLYHLAVDGFSAASGDITLNWALQADQVAPGELAVSPAGGFAAEGPVGGPFTPVQGSVTTYSLTNIGGSALSYTISESLPWLQLSSTSGVLSAGASTEVTVSVTADANSLAAGNYSGPIQFNGLMRTASLNVQAPPPGPAFNDDFADATDFVGVETQASGDNQDATKETGEPNHAGNAGGRSLWWRWVPAESGLARVNTVGSNFDTLLAVYQGSQVNGLSEVASNDDSAGTQSAVNFMATAGQTYFVVVDGYNGASGNIQISLSIGNAEAPANDDFADAAELSGDSAEATASSLLATRESAEPDHAGGNAGRSLWWRWTAPTDGRVEVATLGSDFDSVLAVYTGSSIDGLTEVASNDDAARPRGTRSSRVVFTASAGQSYAIAVAGYNGAGGAVVLNVGPLPAQIFHSGFEAGEQ